MAAKSNKLCFLLLILSFTGGMVIYGQQTVQLSQFSFNKYQLNPAFGGFDNSLSITSFYRSQWEGFAGAPRSQGINAHLPVYLLKGGAGVQIMSESIGAQKFSQLALSYNFVIPTQIGLFSFGLKAGFIQKSILGDKLRALGGIYEGNAVEHNDPVLPNGLVRAGAPEIGLGICFVNSIFAAGIATDYLNQPKFNFSLVEESSIKQRTHFNAYFQYHYILNESFTIHPSFFTKTDLKVWQTDISLQTAFEEKLFINFGFRGYNSKSFDAIIVGLAGKLNRNITLAYSYDLGISPIKNEHTGSHEIVLNYNLNKSIGQNIRQRIIYNPRFLEQ